MMSSSFEQNSIATTWLITSVLALAIMLCLASSAPWLVTLCFGLLHGFGFAEALTEVGLPKTDTPLALLFFNVDVEMGLLMFVSVVLRGKLLVRKISVHWPVWCTQITPYAIGSVAFF